MSMKEWLAERGLSYRDFAAIMGQSPSSICKKVNGETPWQQCDLLFLHDRYGLSSDFVLGIAVLPYPEEVGADSDTHECLLVGRRNACRNPFCPY
ncbi:MAG: helix-turn-helix transcriptional regulator [Bifidobacterium scardovii]|uniref:helix-turn-helix domain-containing protein n=1 Tax=Bifidobacterium scardovii TaxID=158787 RepID=UPI002904C7F4|nr:helix-turn-helix transcriptional regulator [Bifidobacterium scardovii]MDU2421855.1 helix-turn-helix transcriptional regulator [Bifidobacterium scardovii]